jgi:hypothetical protein
MSQILVTVLENNTSTFVDLKKENYEQYIDIGIHNIFYNYDLNGNLNI